MRVKCPRDVTAAAAAGSDDRRLQEDNTIAACVLYCRTALRCGGLLSFGRRAAVKIAGQLSPLAVQTTPPARPPTAAAAAAAAAAVVVALIRRINNSRRRHVVIVRRVAQIQLIMLHTV